MSESVTRKHKIEECCAECVDEETGLLDVPLTFIMYFGTPGDKEWFRLFQCPKCKTVIAK